MPFLARLDLTGPDQASSDQAGLDPTRPDRTTIDRAGTLRGPISSPMDAPVDVVVDNLSISGCLITTDLALPIDMMVSIGIPGIGARAARVCRNDAPYYGLAFAASISEADVAVSRSAQTLVTGAFGVTIADEADTPLPGGLSARRRMGIILGAGLLGWAAVGSALLLLASR